MEHLPGIEDISDGYYWIRRSGLKSGKLPKSIAEGGLHSLAQSRCNQLRHFTPHKLQ